MCVVLLSCLQLLFCIHLRISLHSVQCKYFLFVYNYYSFIAHSNSPYLLPYSPDPDLAYCFIYFFVALFIGNASTHTAHARTERAGAKRR